MTLFSICQTLNLDSRVLDLKLGAHLVCLLQGIFRVLCPHVAGERYSFRRYRPNVEIMNITDSRNRLQITHNGIVIELHMQQQIDK